MSRLPLKFKVYAQCLRREIVGFMFFFFPPIRKYNIYINIFCIPLNKNVSSQKQSLNVTYRFFLRCAVYNGCFNVVIMTICLLGCATKLIIPFFHLIYLSSERYQKFSRNWKDAGALGLRRASGPAGSGTQRDTSRARAWSFKCHLQPSVFLWVTFSDLF